MASAPPQYGPLTQLLVDLAADPELLQRWLTSEDEREAIMEEYGLSEEQKAVLRSGDLHEIHKALEDENPDLAAPDQDAATTPVAMVVTWRVPRPTW